MAIIIIIIIIIIIQLRYSFFMLIRLISFKIFSVCSLNKESILHLDLVWAWNKGKKKYSYSRLNFFDRHWFMNLSRGKMCMKAIVRQVYRASKTYAGFWEAWLYFYIFPYGMKREKEYKTRIKTHSTFFFNFASAKLKRVLHFADKRLIVKLSILIS
jgi:hypothetical protein